MNNANIISVVIGDLVTKIERDAFYCCVNLTRVVLGTSVNEMAWGGFLGLFPPFNTCYRLMEVCNKSSMNISSFPRSAKFSYCAPRIYTNENESKLVRTSDGFIKYVDGSVVELIGYIGEETNVVIPSDVTHLSVSFYENQNVKTVTLGKNVFSVGAYAFLKCTALSSFYIDSSNTSFSVVDGNLYDINGTTLVKYAIGKLDKEYVMPDGVKNIQDYAFSHGKYLESIEADNLENIGEYAFCNCEKLKTVDIYCNTLFIGEYAFSGCTALTSVKFMQTAFTSVTFMTVSNGGSEPKKIIVLAPETNAKNLSETYSSYCWEYNI